MSAHSINPSHRRAADQAGSALLYGTFGLLLFGPLAFGAVEPWSILLLETGSAALFLLWIGKQILEGEMKIRWNPLFLPIGIFGLLIVAQLVFRRSAYPHDTISLLLQYIAYAMLCFLACQTLLRSTQARRLAFVFSIYGATLAAFALIQGISSNGKLYWLRQPRNGGWIYGPYVNHNHYAGLMEMLFPIPLTMCLSRRVERGPRIWLALTAAYVAFPRKSPKVAMTFGAGLAVAGLWVLLVGGTTVTDRLLTFHTEAHTELSNGLRLTVTKDCARMFADRPLFGFGLGTFPTAYPPYQSFYSNIFVNEAHNDYMQLLVEMGLGGFGVMVWLLVLLFRSA